jgi:hypothetical protein
MFVTFDTAHYDTCMCAVYLYSITINYTLVQRSPTVCLYVCDQETLKREAKGSPWTISASERRSIV